MFTMPYAEFLLALMSLLAILVGLELLWVVAMLDHLGGRIDVFFRANYVSVLAANEMKERLERMESSALFSINGHDEESSGSFRAGKPLLVQSVEKEQ